MEAFFVVLFLTGVALAALSVLSGLGHLGVHMPHIHKTDLLYLHLGGSVTGDIAPVNATTIAAFLAWFGGFGYLLASATSLSALLVVPVAALAGTFGALLVALFLIRVLLPGRTPALHPEDYRIEGTLGRLTVPISEEELARWFTTGSA